MNSTLGRPAAGAPDKGPELGRPIEAAHAGTVDARVARSDHIPIDAMRSSCPACGQARSAPSTGNVTPCT